MSKKAVLGKGFEGLIPTDMDIASVATPGEMVKQLSLSAIMINPDQPRKNFDELAIKELAASIEQHGIIQPLVVTPVGDKKGMHRIVAGERRYRAAQQLQLKQVPAIVRNHAELEELEVSLVENVQRVDLSPLEQAVSIVRLRDQFSMSTAKIAKKLGKAEPTISNIIRLLQLPEAAVQALRSGSISEGHARAILALKTDENLQTELLNTIITQKLSVRAAEEFVKNKKIELKDAQQAQLSKKTAQRLAKLKKAGIDAKIVTRKKGGLLQVAYTDDASLQAVLAKLEN